MLTLGLMLMASCVIFELFLVYKIPELAHMLEHNALLAIGFSLGLSWLLGFIFGAAGLIVIFAGVGSTVCTAIIYKLHILDGIHWLAGSKEK